MATAPRRTDVGGFEGSRGGFQAKALIPRQARMEIDHIRRGTILVWRHATLNRAGLMDATVCLCRCCLARGASPRWDDPKHQLSIRHTVSPSDHWALAIRNCGILLDGQRQVTLPAHVWGMRVPSSIVACREKGWVKVQDLSSMRVGKAHRAGTVKKPR